MTNDNGHPLGADLPHIMTANQVGKAFNVSACTARRWLRSGLMPGFRIGHRWYASRKAIYAHVEGITASGGQIPTD